MSSDNNNPIESVGSAPMDSPAEQVGTAPAGSAPGAPAEQLGSAPVEAGQAPQDAAPVKKKRKLVRLLAWPIVLVILLAGAWWLKRDDPVRAEVGSCLAGTTAGELNADKLKVVECGAADAGFKVEGRVEGKTETEADAACDPFSKTEYVFWGGSRRGSTGVVLCLSEVTH